MTEDKIVRTLYVNVYQEERRYGGAEEGGWWYSSYTPLESEATKCNCNLPIREWPIQDEETWDYIGWHVELDTFLIYHEEDCPCVSKFKEFEDKWICFKDDWYPQSSGDDSEPRRGESFTSGTITVRIELMKGSNKPEQIPMYS